MRLVGLLTTYEDADWLPFALKSFEQLDGGVIVEGAYQETIKLGKSPRSQDGTIDLCKHFVSYMFDGCDTGGNPFFIYDETNQESDAQQRNYALSLLKKRFPGNDVVMMIIDGDEEYTIDQINQVRRWAAWLVNNPIANSGILWSKVYLSNAQYTLHAFPRLFYITPGCTFINDNFMYWPEYNYQISFSDREDKLTKFLPYSLAATHHSYQRPRKKFEMKRQWWLERTGSFPWDWNEKSDKVSWHGNENIVLINKHA